MYQDKPSGFWLHICHGSNRVNFLISIWMKEDGNTCISVLSGGLLLEMWTRKFKWFLESGKQYIFQIKKNQQQTKPTKNPKCWCLTENWLSVHNLTHYLILPFKVTKLICHLLSNHYYLLELGIESRLPGYQCSLGNSKDKKKKKKVA